MALLGLPATWIPARHALVIEFNGCYFMREMVASAETGPKIVDDAIRLAISLMSLCVMSKQLSPLKKTSQSHKETQQSSVIGTGACQSSLPGHLRALREASVCHPH
jgi:hypothetical protein